eukprot:TRINITY_DN32175_c0_g1_i1.p3 TRINITY_DN32175_c0_g1~~TRINITY_DN32175_c0_g1_i1.p3  ORF type:complete len:105 (-),score=10.57 TRINITY_DN32175_c0_g1_i1:112-426(-)
MIMWGTSRAFLYFTVTGSRRVTYLQFRFRRKYLLLRKTNSRALPGNFIFYNTMHFLWQSAPYYQTPMYSALIPVSYTHLRAHETSLHLVCRLLLEKKKKKTTNI